MMSRRYRRTTAAALGVLAMASNAVAAEGNWGGSNGAGNGQGNWSGPQGGWNGSYGGDPTLQQKIALLRQKVKYVFVIFNENEGFDHFFGTLPRRQRSLRSSRRASRPPIRWRTSSSDTWIRR